MREVRISAASLIACVFAWHLMGLQLAVVLRAWDTGADVPRSTLVLLVSVSVVAILPLVQALWTARRPAGRDPGAPAA